MDGVRKMFLVIILFVIAILEGVIIYALTQAYKRERTRVELLQGIAEVQWEQLHSKGKERKNYDNI